MTRREALGALAVAVALVAAGLTWLFGPYGLLISGISLGALVLLIDVRESPGEAVAGTDAKRAAGGVSVQLR